MKPEPKSLGELNDKAKNYKVKVKVIQKASAQQSPNKTRYQRLILQDDIGTTMKATLFNNDIDKYEEALQRNGEYEISNATIQPVPEQYRSKPNEFQMTINDRAHINPLITDPTILEPQYQTIFRIPKDPHNEELFDILGIVIFVEELRSINRGKAQEDNVREIVVTDHSCDRPLIISVWNDLARVQSELLSRWAETFIVIGFTALRARPHKGFSLASTMSTSIILDPEGPKADALRTWGRNNKTILNDRRSKTMEIRFPSQKRVITTTEEINSRKASKTCQEERFWLEITMPTATSNNLHMYLGCSKCGRRDNAEEGSTYNCHHCSSNDVVSVPRATFKINAADSTGTTEITLFTKEVETLLRMTCVEIWALKNADNQDLLEEKIQKVKNKTTYVQIGPTLALSTSQVLSWVVRAI